MSRSQYVLRWICVIPAAIAAVILISIPIHWFVMINFGGASSDPVIEIRNASTLQSIELFFRALLAPFAFVYAGAKTAPGHKLLTAVILGGALMISVPALAYWINSGSDNFQVNLGIKQMLARAVGVASAIYLIFSAGQSDDA